MNDCSDINVSVLEEDPITMKVLRGKSNPPYTHGKSFSDYVLESIMIALYDEELRYKTAVLGDDELLDHVKTQINRSSWIDVSTFVDKPVGSEDRTINFDASKESLDVFVIDGFPNTYQLSMASREMLLNIAKRIISKLYLSSSTVRPTHVYDSTTEKNSFSFTCVMGG